MMLEKLLGLPISASEQGPQIDRLIFYVHILMVVLFVGWILFFLYILFRFRASRQRQVDYVGVKTHASSYLEATVAVIEILLLVGLSIPFWSWKVSAFPTEPNTVRVRVIAQQFAWNIHYPGPDGIFGRTDIKLVDEQTNPIGLDRKGDPHAKDDIVTINQLHLPVNRPAIVEITTKDVIHSFFLPVMRVKQDAIPGMIIPIHFVPTKTSDEMREELAVTIALPTAKTIDTYVSMEDYKGGDGSVIAKKGRSISKDTAAKLVENGITQVRIGPRVPAEIACAQLCGLGHYRMRGFVTIDSEPAYAAWLKEEGEALEE
jgi:cytochrome c oxidase subunit II